MSRRFGKESELVKALHSKPIEQIPTVMPDQCQEEGCMSLRTGSTRLPDGSMAHTYSRGKADIYIRDKHGHFVFATCQACYMKRLDAAGLDQLSQVIVEGITAPQREMGFVAGAPKSLADHLRALEDEWADQWIANHGDIDESEWD